MPYVVSCPKCSARLRSKIAMPAGRQLTCPQCKTTFTTKEPAKLIPDAKPNGPPAPPKKPGVAEPDIVEDAEVIDDVEEVEETPRPKKRRVDDDDDRPRSKHRVDDDDDDRPRSKRRVDDDDDDRPRRRKRDDEDDVYRARKRKKKRKGGRGLLIGGLVGALVVLLVGVALILNLTGVFTLFGGGASSDMLVWAPEATTRIVYADYAELNQIATRVRKPGDPPDRDKYIEFGLKNSDLTTVMLATVEADATPTVSVFKLKNNADQQAIAKAIGATEVAFQGKKYFKGTTACAHFPALNMVVITPTEAKMQETLRNGTKVLINKDMQEATGRGRGAAWVAAIGQGLPGGAPSRMEGGQLVTIKVVVASVSVSGNWMDIRTETTYDSVASAEKRVERTRELYKKAKEPPPDGMKVDITASGATVIETISVPIDKSGGFGAGFGAGLGLGF